MQVTIDTRGVPASTPVAALFAYYRSLLEPDVERLTIAVDRVDDDLGRSLHRCRLSLRSLRGGRFEIEEIQASARLAVTRALDRALRRIRRRHAVPGAASLH